MPTTQTFLLFLTATLAVLVVPGPSVVYVVARSLEQGRRAGLVSMLGLETGMLVHVLASASGVAAVIASSGTAFALLKYAGAAYLVHLGIRQLRQPSHLECAPEIAAPRPGASYSRLFRDGFVVDLLNPKTSLFFVAFLPQFVDPGRGPAAGQLLVLGLCVLPMAVICDGCYALLAGGFGRHRHLDRITGLAYLGLAGAAVVV